MQSISLLASRSDDVLKWAFPTGNFVSGLFSRGAPYVHEAMGRRVPAEPYPSPDNIYDADWQIPDGWDYGHSSYLPPNPLGPAPGAICAFAKIFPPPDMLSTSVIRSRRTGKWGCDAFGNRVSALPSRHGGGHNLRLVTLACPKAMEACWASELWRRRRNSRVSRSRFSKKASRRIGIVCQPSYTAFEEPPVPTRNVNLTKELDRFIARSVKRGRYANASEVMRSALRLLEREERETRRS